MISIGLAFLFFAFVFLSTAEPTPGGARQCVLAATLSFWACLVSLFL